jgi:iron complex outermembrane receptor protein
VLTNLGNTNIAFSPEIVGGGKLTFLPVKNLQLTWLGKFVGKQYMGNIDSENSTLTDYTVLDFNVNYDLKINKGIKSIMFSGLVNNILNRKYESNGYFYTYDDTWSGPGTTTIEGTGFYPQAGINFLLGMTLKF